MTMPIRPLVSVIMSVHNGERFLNEAIESILRQTYAELEFIVIDDGSTDSSHAIIHRYAKVDARIVPISRGQKGLAKSLNEAIAVARGEFIARQDADDISKPHRVATMIDFLTEHPTIAAAGSWCDIADESGKIVNRFTPPVDPDQICWAMIGRPAIAHPSAVLRRESIVRYGAYDEAFVYAQDYELWTRWIRLGARLGNVPQYLVTYRVSSSQVSMQYSAPQSESASRSAEAYLDFLLQRRLEPRQIAGVRQLITGAGTDSSAVCGVPLLLELLRLPRFQSSMDSAAIRYELAKKCAMAIRRFGAADPRSALSGLATSLSISTWVVFSWTWWVALLKRLLAHR